MLGSFQAAGGGIISGFTIVSNWLGDADCE
jgi:hypothetical protein